MFQAPTNHPPTRDDRVRSLQAEIEELKFKAEAVLERSVKGPRGQLLTVNEAQERASRFREVIEGEEADNSQRHRQVPLTTKLLILTVVVIVDFPIMFWLASSVFNVDWGGLL